MADKLFYAVFHGLIPLFEFRDHFLAVLLKDDDHKVVAGHWLSESHLRKGEHELIGVASGGAGLDSDTDLVASIPALDMQKVKEVAFATIKMPKPKRLFSFCTKDLPSGYLKGADAKNFKRYSAVHVLQYECTGEVIGVKVNGLGAFHPRLMVKDSMEFDVLHFYNEPEKNPHWTHSRDEFNYGLTLISGVAVEPVTSALDFPDLNSIHDIPSGLLHPELASSLSGRELAIYQALMLARGANVGVFGGEAGSHFCGTMNARVN